MAPFYQETVENGVYVMPRLKSDDIRAIQAIYGKEERKKNNFYLNHIFVSFSHF
ncbi:unnamed protein product [Meloidogyne enterolobii]|uniref:Uncharacterized protein n=1 Tax=Meloidogyne enterolobii TaxID=390850 RepID=A0ACB0XNS6_MELEN